MRQYPVSGDEVLVEIVVVLLFWLRGFQLRHPGYRGGGVRHRSPQLPQPRLLMEYEQKF